MFIRIVIVILCLLFDKLSKAQIITTVAGIGIAGDTGDGYQATNAEINLPILIVFDKQGNLYFSERIHNKVRMISACGVINTIAGNGMLGYSGDNEKATIAKLNNPTGITIDLLNNIYVSDFGNNRIRKIDAITGIISTYVGNGIAGYSGDNGPATLASINGACDITTDNNGNLFLTDNLNNRINVINLRD